MIIGLGWGWLVMKIFSLLDVFDVVLWVCRCDVVYLSFWEGWWIVSFGVFVVGNVVGGIGRWFVRRIFVYGVWVSCFDCNVFMF